MNGELGRKEVGQGRRRRRDDAVCEGDQVLGGLDFLIQGLRFGIGERVNGLGLGRESPGGSVRLARWRGSFQ